jgi:hypothetical protein
MGSKDLYGLEPYLYKEGFVYHLIPFKPEGTDLRQPRVNSMVMYNNVVNKFKYGNFKHAKNLDEQSTNLFYPVIASTYLELTQSLMAEGHNDLALKALQKYDQEMPDLYPYPGFAQSKYWLIDTAYRLHAKGTANKYVNDADNYLTDQLNYNYNLLKNSPEDVNTQNVQFEVSVLSGIAGLAKQNEEAALGGKLQAQVDDYTKKFQGIVQR